MADKRLLSEKDIEEIFMRFEKQNPEPEPELDAPNPYCFLVSVVLSAQATDRSVNKATESLYKTVKTPEEMLALGEQNLVSYIKPVGLANSKAKHIMELSRSLVERFNSKIPETREELMTLSGVGRKTANVVLNVIFGEPTMPVDTHISRVSPRIGLCRKGKPEEIEAALLKAVPKRFGRHAHHWILLHGRYVCTAKNPGCETCMIRDLCQKNL